MTIQLGVLGDSGVDSYRGTDNRGGDYAAITFGPVDLLVLLRGFDCGEWGNYDEPRRTDYAYNWARSGATSTTMISGGQHTGLASQVTAGSPRLCWIRIGSNDFRFSSDNYQNTYNGSLSGESLQTVIDQCVSNVFIAADTLISASPLGIVGQLFPRRTAAEAAAAGFSNATYHQRVTDALNEINDGIISGFNNRSIPYRDQSVWNDIYVYDNGNNIGFDVWDERIISDSNGDEPHHALLSDNEHLGTIANGLWVNYMLLEPLNEAYGLNIRFLKPWELLWMVNISNNMGGKLERA